MKVARINRGRIGVFTRNWPEYLDEATDLCAAAPERQVTFRSAARWVSAARVVAEGVAIPIYMAAIGANREVEYVAELCDVQLDPFEGDPKTKRLLALQLPKTVREGLDWSAWGKGRVQTLYTIRHIRRVRPFQLSTLTKAVDGTPLSDEFTRAYALVVPKPDEI